MRGTDPVSEYSEREMEEPTNECTGVRESLIDDPDDGLMTERNMLTVAGGLVTTDLWLCE
jgi:hypothetical protein